MHTLASLIRRSRSRQGAPLGEKCCHTHGTDVFKRRGDSAAVASVDRRDSQRRRAQWTSRRCCVRTPIM